MSGPARLRLTCTSPFRAPARLQRLAKKLVLVNAKIDYFYLPVGRPPSAASGPIAQQTQREPQPDGGM